MWNENRDKKKKIKEERKSECEKNNVMRNEKSDRNKKKGEINCIARRYENNKC